MADKDRLPHFGSTGNQVVETIEVGERRERHENDTITQRRKIRRVHKVKSSPLGWKKPKFS